MFCLLLLLQEQNYYKKANLRTRPRIVYLWFFLVSGGYIIDCTVHFIWHIVNGFFFIYDILRM